MKSLIKIFTLSAVITITSWIAPQQMKAQGVTVGFQVFYDDLSPYGTWVNSPEYGYVWVPTVDAGFTPYGTNGYWVNTDAGWTWVSNYSWGWAPFHYGRWYTDPVYGNMWVPGSEWGPGWVCWRQSEGYYGWAPIGPGISIEVAYSNNYRVPDDRWCFVRNGDFGRTDIGNHYVNRSTNVTIIKNTTVINNTTVEGGRRVTYNAGPPRAEAEKRAGKTFTPVAVKESSKPGQSMGKGELQIYKPQVQKSNSTAKKEAPAKVVALKDLKTSGQKTAAAPAQKTAQPAKQQPAQSQSKTQPAKQESAPKQNPSTPAKQQPTQTQQKNAPAKQQPAQQKNPVQPAKQQPVQAKPKTEPIHQEPKPQNKEQPPHQQPQPKAEPRRQEPPRQEPPRQEAPREEQPRQEAPRQEPPRQEAPHQEGERPH